MECLRTFVCYLNVNKCLTHLNIPCVVKHTIPTPKPRMIPRISRVTELVLSQACLFLFALSMFVLTGLPLYFLREWLPSLGPAEYTLLFSAYLLLMPVAFLMARQSLLLLRRVEMMGGRRVSFRRQYRKLKRRERRINRVPSPGTVIQTDANRPVPAQRFTNQRAFTPAVFLNRLFIREV